MRSHPGEIRKLNANEENRVKLVRVQKYLEDATLYLYEALRLAKTIEDPRVESITNFLDSDLRVLAPTSQAVRLILEQKS